MKKLALISALILGMAGCSDSANKTQNQSKDQLEEAKLELQKAQEKIKEIEQSMQQNGQVATEAVKPELKPIEPVATDAQQQAVILEPVESTAVGAAAVTGAVAGAVAAPSVQQRAGGQAIAPAPVQDVAVVDVTPVQPVKKQQPKPKPKPKAKPQNIGPAGQPSDGYGPAYQNTEPAYYDEPEYTPPPKPKKQKAPKYGPAYQNTQVPEYGPAYDGS